MISKATCRQLLSSSMVLLTSFLYGCKVGYTQSATPIFISPNPPFPVTTDEISWIASISYTGTLISVVVCYTIGSKVRRKLFLFGCTLTFAVVWFLILVTSSIYVVIACFFFYGIAASMLTIIGHVYFSEIASPKNREILGIAYIIATMAGVLVEFPLSVLKNYRLLSVFPLLLSIVTLLSSMFMVESPYYLILKGLDKQAITNLCWLNDKSNAEDVTGHYNDAKKYVEEQRGTGMGNLRTLLLPGNLKLVLTTVVINVAMIFNTGNIIAQYGSVMVQDFSSNINETLFVNIHSALGLISSLLSFAVVRKYPRKGLVIFGFILTGLIHLICAVCYYVEAQNENHIAYLAFVIAFFLLINQLSLCSLDALAVLMMEVFPHKLKEFYMSLLAFTSDCTGFVVVKSYIFLSNSWGIHYILLIYGSINLGIAMLVYICIIDTKGKSLYEIRTDYATFAE